MENIKTVCPLAPREPDIFLNFCVQVSKALNKDESPTVLAAV